MGIYKELFYEIENLPENGWERLVDKRLLGYCKDTPSNRNKVMLIVNQLKEMKHEICDIPSFDGFGRQITAWIRETEDYCMGVEIQWQRPLPTEEFGHWEIRTWMCH